MKSEKEKMLAGELYDSADSELLKLRVQCRNILQKYNLDYTGKTNALLNELFQKETQNVFIQPPFYCDYGFNIELGKNVYMNYNCVILDCAKVTIGENTLLGPNVQIYTAENPLKAEERITFKESAKEIKIGKNCWIGGSAVILAGVTIGDNCVIGAGAVVTKDVPQNSIAVGNPARVVRAI